MECLTSHNSSKMDAMSKTDRIIEDARKAYDEGNYRGAIEMLTPLLKKRETLTGVSLFTIHVHVLSNVE